MRRIQAFLICDEINDTIIATGNGQGEDAIRIKDKGSFHWGLKMKPDLPPRRGRRGEASKGAHRDAL